MPKPAVIDIDGSEAVSAALLSLLNAFPGLSKPQSILFSTLSQSTGIGFFPTTGAAIQDDKEDVLGHVVQSCQYPFSVVYRAAPTNEIQRLKIKEFLDTLGRWLERQPVIVNGEEQQLEAYPALKSGSRVIKAITRTNPARLNAAYQDGIEDWLISGKLVYENEFYR